MSDGGCTATTEPEPGPATTSGTGPSVAPAAPSRVEMRAIRKSYGGVEVLHGVDLSVRTGEVHALVGENGAGKSTLMKILAGDVSPDSGSIAVSGSDVVFRSPHDSQRAGISMIQQELSYVGPLSVAENLVLGRLPTRGFGIVDRRSMLHHARQVISNAGLAIDATRQMSALSLIEKQLVEILKATDRSAGVIVMDEPTSSLTSSEVELLFGLTRQLCASGVSVIYISHHLDEVFSIADRVTVLKDGSRVSTRSVSEVTHDSLVRDMVGGVVEAARRAAVGPGQETILTVRSLTIPDGPTQVSFDLHAGEVYGLYGLLGAGQERIARRSFRLRTRLRGYFGVGRTAAQPQNAASGDRVWHRLCALRPEIGRDYCSTLDPRQCHVPVVAWVELSWRPSDAG